MSGFDRSPKTVNGRAYEGYLKSSHWINTKRRIRAERKKCEACFSVRSLQVHHKTYKNVGRELDEDLSLLCETCHSKVHSLHRASDSDLKNFTEEFITWSSASALAQTKYALSLENRLKINRSRREMERPRVEQKISTEFIPERRRLTERQRRSESVSGRSGRMGGLPIRSA